MTHVCAKVRDDDLGVAFFHTSLFGKGFRLFNEAAFARTGERNDTFYSFSKTVQTASAQQTVVQTK